MKTHRLKRLLLTLAGSVLLPLLAMAQLPADPGDSSGAVVSTSTGTPLLPLPLTYARPTEKTRLRNYLFDAFGPYPIAGAALTAGVNQANGDVPEWRQGASGYSRRFGSNFGIAAVSTTTRYALAKAFREDALYYRCECTGLFPRLRHAVASTLTVRRGEDGHRAFSLASLAAPYAGTMTAVYAWYPGRYGAKDAFRMGNYSLLGYAAGNIALEFLYGGPHSWPVRMHLAHRHPAPEPAPKS
jgi:hypothetical protein